MCKLYIATGKLTRKQVARALAQANIVFRKTEADGFGFLAANASAVARGRYLNPHTFAGYMQGLPDFLSGPCIEENVIPVHSQALIVHGRTSTNSKGLDNVHPFFAKGVYLAHNGIVHWQGQGPERSPHTCDTAQFLHWFVRQSDHATAWREAFVHWGGFGAMGVYDQSTGLLTVARDTANLYIARRASNRGWVFATDAGHLLQISRAASIQLDTLPLAFPQHIVQFNGADMVDSQYWRGFATRDWSYYGQGNLVARTHGVATTAQITGHRSDGASFSASKSAAPRADAVNQCTPSKEAFPDYEKGEI
jgi:hypothetical protein